MGEKTEKATPKKLRDARKKGQVAKSQDLPSAFTFLASVSLVLILLTYMYHAIGGFTIGVFESINSSNLDKAIPNLFYHAFETIFLVSMPVLALVALIGVLVNFLSIGPVFAIEVFKPNIKKFDPVQNIKAKFKLKTLFELLKSLFKISVAAYLIYGVMYKSIPVLIQTVSLPLAGSLLVLKAFLIEVLLKVGLLFIAVAVADFIFQKRNFAKEMKMEKFEVKQEYKNTEGDPQIKGKRRQIAQEIAYQEGPAQTMKEAKAVVTNPTHLAIALAYEKELDAAPFIVAMGKERMAEKILEIAKEYDIPVMQNIPLARKLWETGELFEYVPEETYETLADILRWVASLEEEKELDIGD